MFLTTRGPRAARAAHTTSGARNACSASTSRRACTRSTTNCARAARAAGPARAARHARGFTLVELMVALALVGMLLKLAAPSFGLWIRNSQVRALSESVRAGVMVAQSEALRRNRQVVFFLTNTSACTATTAAAAGGLFWAVRTVPLVSGEAPEMVQCGVLADLGSAATVNGPTALCFNSAGRQTANTQPGPSGAFCMLSATGSNRYDVTASGSDRAQAVLVTLGGQVRLCDPNRVLSASVPDGCPA